MVVDVCVDVCVAACVAACAAREITPGQVEANLRGAMVTAAMLDDSEWRCRADLRSAMPEPLPNRRRDYADEEPRTSRLRPTADAIGLMNEAPAWLW